MRENAFVGYEYQEKRVKRSMLFIYADGYENFGWQLIQKDETLLHSGHAIDWITLRFRRNRKIPNRAELTRLQRHYDACLSEISALESSGYRKASAAAYAVGIAGTLCMTGAVFAATAGNAAWHILLAVPALIGWILPYFLFRKIHNKKSAALAPLIEQKYEELYTVCERANALL